MPAVGQLAAKRIAARQEQAAVRALRDLLLALLQEEQNKFFCQLLDDAGFGPGPSKPKPQSKAMHALKKTFGRKQPNTRRPVELTVQVVAEEKTPAQTRVRAGARVQLSPSILPRKDLMHQIETLHLTPARNTNLSVALATRTLPPPLKSSQGPIPLSATLATPLALVTALALVTEGEQSRKGSKVRDEPVATPAPPLKPVSERCTSPRSAAELELQMVSQLAPASHACPLSPTSRLSIDADDRMSVGEGELIVLLPAPKPRASHTAAAGRKSFSIDAATEAEANLAGMLSPPSSLVVGVSAQPELHYGVWDSGAANVNGAAKDAPRLSASTCIAASIPVCPS